MKAINKFTRFGGWVAVGLRALISLAGWAAASEDLRGMPREDIAVEQCLLWEMFSSTRTFDCAKIRRLVPAAALWRGTDSKIGQREYHRIVNQAQWEFLWHRHTGRDEPPPSIDFARLMAVAVFSQGAQGDQPLFAKAIESKNAIVFYFTGWAAQQEQGAPIGMTNPFCIYVLPWSAKKLILKERHESMAFPAGFGTAKEIP